MKGFDAKGLGAALGAGLLATAALLPQAKGELVYENESSTEAQVEDRSAMRGALDASERAQVTMQTEGVAAPVAATPETEHYSKAELMRRERQREELKNEDILQERLEELRLRDERRRTQEMMAGASLPATGAPQANPVVAQAPIKEEVVISTAPAMATTPARAPAPDMVAMSQSMSVAPGMEGVAAAEPSERMTFSVTPRGGISDMVGQGGYFDVRPRYSAGVAVGMGASDHFSLEVGYMFSQYGIAMASTNPWVVMMQQQASWNGQAFEALNMNQNVFNAGVKLHLLSVDSRIRPFFGAGGAYSMSYINFSSGVLSQMNQLYGTNISPDYTVKNFLGYLSSGLDVKVAKNIAVGAEFRYYAVLSDNESANFNTYYPVFYNYYGGYSMGANPLSRDTQVAGGSLARTSFYSILGTVSFTF